MLLRIGTITTSRQTATRGVAVSCEKCKCIYLYEMMREAIGVGIMPGLGPLQFESQAHDMARQNASRDVERLMAGGCDPVPCPDCGWYQSYMVEAIKRRGGSGLASSLNAAYPCGVPLLVPGAPPPILVKRAPGRNSVCYPTIENQKPNLDQNGFMLLPWGRHELPKRCCLCGQNAISVIHLPFGFPMKRTYGVPMCTVCKSRRQSAGVTAGLISALITAAAGIASVIYAFRTAGPVGAEKNGIPVAVILSIAACVLLPPLIGVLVRLIVKASRPAAAIVHDAGDGLVAVGFRSGEYREVVRSHIAAQRIETIFTDLTVDPPGDFVEYMESKGG